jgi:hypothetical protein
MSNAWKTTRRSEYLGKLGDDDRRISKFMGTGPEGAADRLRNLTTNTPVNFKTSSLITYHKYVSTLAGTIEDGLLWDRRTGKVRGRVWTKRKELLEKAIDLGLGLDD